VTYGTVVDFQAKNYPWLEPWAEMGGKAFGPARRT
jgi:hypothetical protein